MAALKVRGVGIIAGIIVTCVLPIPSGTRSVLAGPPCASDTPATAGTPKSNLSGHALRLLQEGNQRFIDGKPIHPNTDVFRISDTGERGQRPFAAIVTCADSRLAVERLFDRGVGDLFVVRVAGAIGGPNQTGSVEYACEHLGTQLVVVMGHTRCGAVKAAVEGAEAGRNIGSLLSSIAPAVETTRSRHPRLSGDELVEAAVRENVWTTIESMITGSTILRDVLAAGRVQIVGAVYDVASGRVEWLGNHPSQTALLSSAPEASAAATPAETKTEQMPAEKTTAAKPAAEKPAPAAAKPTAAKPASPSPAKTGEHAPAHASTPH
ncbi:MAG: carbonic anhydrase [Phycisphaerales bacterium]